MKIKQEQYDVGVVIGRFQVPELHQAHIDLIQTVRDEHPKVLVFLGLSPLRVTRENPLDFEARKQMILAHFPDVSVLYVVDQASDEAWSRRLDEQISHLVTPSQSVVLYGGRDSFQEHYSGRYDTRELVQEVWVSGKEIRRAIASRSVKASPDFRAGVVWASQSRFPTCYPTVDVAILDDDESHILLGRKEGEEAYRLIGGFADPASPSYEADARREVQEEAGVMITDPVYVGSAVVDDWRYRGEVDVIKTILFKCHLLSGRPTPSDDIVEVRWIPVCSSRDDGEEAYVPDSLVVPQHRALVQMALAAPKIPMTDKDPA